MTPLYLINFGSFFLQQDKVVKQRIYKILEAWQVMGSELPVKFRRVSGTRGLQLVTFPMGAQRWDCYFLFRNEQLFLLHHDLRQKHHLKSKKSIQKALLVIEQLETNHLQLQISSWHALKEQLFGPPNQSIRAELDAAALAFVLAQKLKKAREDCQLTQAQLAALVHKNRAFIAQLEGNADNMTFKTLYEMVTIGLGGRVVVDLKF